VVVYNRTRPKMGTLVAAGAKPAGSVADLVRRSEVVITMVSDPSAVRDVVTAETGLLSALSAGTTHIDMSTVSPETSRGIAVLIRGTGADYLEAPVLGSKEAAEEGTLTILTGGDADLSRRMEPLLLAMGGRVIHIGETGTAAHMKLLINQMTGTLLCVFAEAALAGMEAGIPAEKILEAIRCSGVDCDALRTRGNDMLMERAFTPGFPLKHAYKDMRLAVDTGKAAGIPSPVTQAARDMYGMAWDKGFGDRDMSAVIRALTDK
jgi:3-hydroxyisobutyrate dehydrogenase